MECKQTQDLLDAYLDGELDLLTTLDVEAHLQSCDNCSASYRMREATQTALRQNSLYARPPASLEKRLHVALRQQAGAPAPRNWPRWHVALPAALAILGLVIGLRLTGASNNDDILVRELLASHVRSLLVDHLQDVASTDQHTVKPWFNGKLNFSPPVVDLASQGFPLIGGRLDYLDNQPIAALVFQRHKHVINLFVWPSTHDTSAANNFTQQGYHIVHWSQASMTFWAVSDVNMADLEDFAQLFQNQLSAPATPE